MKLRVIDSEGKDEVYKSVKKFTLAGDKLFIYTTTFTFNLPADTILHFQAWEETNE
jgi:hypothetical protein